jgi:hypothetical protein
LGLTFIYGIRTFWTEELQGVVTQYIRVGEDFVISEILLVLVYTKFSIALQKTLGFLAPGYGVIKHPFKLKGVVI